jgi:hypothetical protein
MGRQRRIKFTLALLALIGVPILAQEPAKRLLIEMQQLDLRDQKPAEQIRIQLAFAEQVLTPHGPMRYTKGTYNRYNHQ